MMRKGLASAGILLISAATLLYELALMRLFAVAEWHHYAFVSVSVALLGNAGSGALAALFTPSVRCHLDAWVASVLPLGVIVSHLALNLVPFDAYQLAWDPRQIAFLLVDYLALALPFGMSGYLLVRTLATQAERSHVCYAASLVGAALGGLGVLALLPHLGGEGIVLAVIALAAAGGLLLRLAPGQASLCARRSAWGLALLTWLGCGALLMLRPTWLAQHISPYKSLSAALQMQNAQHAFQAWNSYSRVDVVTSPNIHSAPGLSLAFAGELPPQVGLTVDADNLSALTRRTEMGDGAYLAYLPGAVAYALRPGGDVMVINPRGGGEIALALYHGARSVLVAEDNALVVHVVRDLYDAHLGGLYHDRRVEILAESGRSALSRAEGPFDILALPLADAFHPLAAGAYGLGENYIMTVEGVGQALARLDTRGVLVITRWEQDPPAEALRTAALLTEALVRRGVADPAAHLIVFRSWSTVTLLASPTPFSSADVQTVCERCAALDLDLVHYAGMSPAEANRFHVMADAQEYELMHELLTTRNRAAFFRRQEYAISPPTDDRPFFDHYFRWHQLPAIVRQLGKTWQPFGGSGYLLVICLLGIASVAVAALLGISLRARNVRDAGPDPRRRRAVVYFVLVGLAYMLVEMPLMQQYILQLGHPARAFAVVLATLLLSSGLGSLIARRAPVRLALGILAVTIPAYAPLTRWMTQATLQWPLAWRVVAAVICLAPLGMLMGLPFSGGLARLGRTAERALPWVWAANGGASVVSSILATVLALAVGYRLVLFLGAACYLCASILCPAPWEERAQARAAPAPEAQR